ncbi:MAG: HlyC/CorC family transporter [Deltaproteobacteria bacterium]|nr:MAG: HlyC/CorC family transporter [Deltaproteobacteria bacterium]
MLATTTGLPLAAAVLLAAGLLVLSFVFSGTETALFSLQKIDRQRLESAGGLGGRVVGLLQRRTTLIATLLIGNETVNVAFASVGANLFEGLTPYPWLDPWLNIAVVTPSLVMISEVTPKIIAFRYNVLWSKTIAWPLTLFSWLVFPLRVVLSGLVGLLARAAQVRPGASEDSLRPAELMGLLDQGTLDGSVEQQERDIVEAVFDFEELTVGRIKTPRPDVFSLAIDTPWPDLLSACREQGYSRVPIYENDPDNIIGVLLIKDVLRFRHAPPTSPEAVRELLLPPVFVPPSKPAQDMLRSFMEKSIHMAFIVDEHGTLVGLVTLDDLLAELFGEFPDIDDEEDLDAQAIGPGAWVVDAGMDLSDFAETTGIPLPEGDYHTLGGFVFHHIGRLPHRGDAITHGGVRFIVRRMEGRRIEEVLVRGGPVLESGEGDP